MATTTSGAFSSLMAPGLRKVYFEELKDWPEEYSQIANVLSSERQYEEDLVLGGLGAFMRKGEGEPIQYDTGKQGSKVRYTHISFGLGFRVTREAKDDDLYNVIGTRMAKQLARSARQTVELEFGALMDDTFAASPTYKGWDAKCLCSASHSSVFGATMTNRPATDVDLGMSSLRAAMENLENTLDERGFPVMKRGALLIVGPSFQWVAKELTQSPNRPYTTDNEINVIKDLGLKYMVYHYGSDDDAWWLVAPKAEQDVKFFWRTRPELKNSDDFDTGDAKFGGYMRFSLGFSEWRGWYGSSGG